MSIKISKCAFLFLMLISIHIRSQNFSYTLQKDSSAYAALTEPQVLSTGEDFQNKSFILHLPFEFNFCGTVTDSLRIEGNGFVVLNPSKALAIVAFNNFTSQKDASQNYVSSIGSLVSGSSGNRIFKIEFKNLAQSTVSATDNLSYQVWLYENGNKIEFHIGSNPFTSDNTLPVLLGLINKNMDTDTKAYLVNGNASSPSGQSISGDTGFAYINNIPPVGTIYTLTPTF